MSNIDVFSTETPNNETNIDVGLNDLVGEGQKYKSPDDLAKAYANLERHARTIEAENARIRGERDSREATNNGQPNGQPQPNSSDNSNQAAPPEVPKANDGVDLRSQIREEFNKLTQEERSVQNMEQTAQKLVDTYGSPQAANEALKARAAELGVGVEWLRDAAARSPSAFYVTMGLNDGARSTNTPAPGGHRINGNTSSVRDFEYYDKLRKDDPKLYFSAATQQEMLKAAREMGGDFYKR